MLKANSAFEPTGKIGSTDLQFTWNDVTRYFYSTLDGMLVHCRVLPST